MPTLHVLKAHQYLYLALPKNNHQNPQNYSNKQRHAFEVVPLTFQGRIVVQTLLPQIHHQVR